MSLEEKFMTIVKNQGVVARDYHGRIVDVADLQPEGRDACVVSSSLPMLSAKYKVVLSPEASEKFDMIKAKIMTFNYKGEQNEVGFFMLGHELDEVDGNRVIYIDTVEATAIQYRGISHNQNARLYDQLMDAHAQNCRSEGHNKPFIFVGHTHPEQRGLPNFLANSWSFQDLWSAYCFSEHYKDDYDNGKFQLGEILITPSLDTNMMFFDRNYKGGMFFRFREGVYEMRKGDKLERNKCFSDPNEPAQRLNPRIYDPELL